MPTRTPPDCTCKRSPGERLGATSAAWVAGWHGASAGRRLLRPLDQSLDLGLRDQSTGLVELDAEPAHDARQVGQLLAFDDFQHARVAARPLFHLERAVDAARDLLVVCDLIP